MWKDHRKKRDKMEKYEQQILENIETLVKDTSVIELPEIFIEMFGEDTTFRTSIEDRFAYMWIMFGGYQISLGFGEQGGYYGEHWNGTLFWQLDTENYEALYSGEINNGSPSYILWELFSAIASNLTTNN